MGTETSKQLQPPTFVPSNVTLQPQDVSIEFNHCPTSHVVLLSLLSSVVTVALLLFASLLIMTLGPYFKRGNPCPPASECCPTICRPAVPNIEEG